MSEQQPENSSDSTETAAIAEQPAAPVARPGLRERVYGFRSVAAVAVAGLIIGGGAGAAIHAATADEGRDGPGRMGFQRGPGAGFNGPGQMPGQGMGPGNGQVPQPPAGVPAPPDGLPGQTQPTTPPEDSVDPDGGDTTSGDNT